MGETWPHRERTIGHLRETTALLGGLANLPASLVYSFLKALDGLGGSSGTTSDSRQKQR